jgi:hypothetical protein
LNNKRKALTSQDSSGGAAHGSSRGSQYPTTLHQAYNVLQSPLSGGDGVAFARDSGGTRNNDLITCFQCGHHGHYANECPTRHEQQIHGSNSMVVGMEYHVFSQAASNIPATWIVLDNQSTMVLFSNPNLLTNIRRSPTRMRVRCNAGGRSTKMVSDLPGYGTVGYDPRSIDNILSLSKVKQKNHVQYNSSDGRFVFDEGRWVRHSFRRIPYRLVLF